MKENYRLEKKDLITWMVKEDDAERVPGIDEACTIERLQAFLDKRVPGCKVTVAEVTDAIFNAPPTSYVQLMWGWHMDSVPIDLGCEYAHVEVEYTSDAGVDQIGFLMPTVWNGRYLGTGGSGSYTNVMWEICGDLDRQKGHRSAQPNVAVRNGFATAWTDGAVRGEMAMVWNPVDKETGIFNEARLRNYDYVALHTRNLVAKALCEALSGEAPKYSYTEATSGGGRMSVRMAQRCPEDVDGIWADCPYMPHYDCSAAIAWAQVAMRDNGDFIPFAKLDAIRECVLARYGGLEGWLRHKERPEFDARECIGMDTEAGPITETDAKVMNMIWDGPRRKDGTRIMYGWRPGAKVWEKGWWIYINDDEGNPIDIPEWEIGTKAYGLWVKRDPSFHWHDITLDNFEEWYDDYYRGYARMDILDTETDLSRMVKAGTKLIIAAGTEDEYVPVDSTIDYYDRVVQATFGGSITEARKSARLFVIPGNDHMFPLQHEGVGPSMADAMIALQRWVEDGIAPDYIPSAHVDAPTAEVDAEGVTDIY